MKAYEFHGFTRDGERAPCLRLELRSDIEASVRSFDLMRERYDLHRVVAVRDGRPIFQRVRVGGKLELEWSGRRRAAPLDLSAQAV